MTRQGLRWLGILRAFDLVDFPISGFGSPQSGDGKFALVADLVEGVFSLGDGADVLFEAKLVGGGDVEQVFSQVIGRSGWPGDGRSVARQIKCRSPMCRNSGRGGNWAGGGSAAARGARERFLRRFSRFMEV